MGIVPSIENLLSVLQELPPGKTADDKYFAGFYEGTRLAAFRSDFAISGP